MDFGIVFLTRVTLLVDLGFSLEHFWSLRVQFFGYCIIWILGGAGADLTQHCTKIDAESTHFGLAFWQTHSTEKLVPPSILPPCCGE